MWGAWISFMILLGCLPCGRADAADAESLLQLKAGMSHAQNLLSDWTEDTTPCGPKEWTGVICVNGSVVKLNLENLGGIGLSGSIPPAWALPPALLDLNLARNRLAGSQISLTWKLPAGLVNLTLTASFLEGSIPAAWQLPPSLRVLRLGSNRLTGSIPPSLSLSASLVELDLAGNLLTGTVPSGWRLPSLQTAWLDSNALRGSLPTFAPSTPAAARIYVLPQSAQGGFCGTVPKSPIFYNAIFDTIITALPIPDCVSTCTDNKLSGSETDVDCGGPHCPRKCNQNQRCSVLSDCINGVCSRFTCVDASCADGKKNGNETDKDCGGVLCPPCAYGQACTTDSDCFGKICRFGACRPATCYDGRRTGMETDIDCGGPECRGCYNGKNCLVASDCISNTCIKGKCLATTCLDGKLNGNETAVDCGGSCSGCKNGQACKISTDCESSVCTENTCQATACVDGKQSGNETDIDCGGMDCATKCTVGKKCKLPSDCVSNVCTGGVCTVSTTHCAKLRLRPNWLVNSKKPGKSKWLQKFKDAESCCKACNDSAKCLACWLDRKKGQVGCRMVTKFAESGFKSCTANPADDMVTRYFKPAAKCAAPSKR